LHDELLRICAGHEQYGGDPQQGVILIKLIEQDQVTTVSQDVYETPEEVGLVHIVVADNNSVTVASEDGQHVYTFDIATRQWVPNPTLPIPSESPLPSPSANDKDVFNTRVAQHLAAIATEAALAPHPTPPQGPVYLESPIPSPTWAVGYFGWVMPPNTIDPEYVSCWHGYLNDKLLRLCAGHEQQGGDPQQGVLQVKVIEQDQVTVISNDVYETPGAFGVVHIVVADSNSVTVASDDGRALYTFDIAARQWVPNPPLPTPSESPLPSPSASP
jgi:hypothetical protein